MWSAHVFLKYWSLQIAGWIVVFAVAWFATELFDWPKRVAWIVVGVWAVKDAVLYPLVWRSYDQRDVPASAYPYAGTDADVLRRLNPTGVVRVRGERWQATAAQGEAPIETGERVRITDRHGMTLTVERTRRSGGAREGDRRANGEGE
jgi:membrane-bound ClpP family serine protease